MEQAREQIRREREQRVAKAAYHELWRKRRIEAVSAVCTFLDSQDPDALEYHRLCTAAQDLWMKAYDRFNAVVGEKPEYASIKDPEVRL